MQVLDVTLVPSEMELLKSVSVITTQGCSTTIQGTGLFVPSGVNNGTMREGVIPATLKKTTLKKHI